jgi:hypothetical protein
MVLTILNIPP